MPEMTGRAAAVAEAIVRYVDAHPRAADTIDGIRGWWIANNPPDATRADIQQALDYLVQAGGLSCVLLPDGVRLYTGAIRGENDDVPAASAMPSHNADN